MGNHLYHYKHRHVITLILIFVLCACPTWGSEVLWTWVNGDSLPGEKSTYGQQGIPHPDNKPGGRDGTASWQTADGKTWLFGGISSSDHNELWNYDQSTNQWVWLRGSKDVFASSNYGTLGIPHPDNDPGARVYSASWTASDGTLWLFGGQYGEVRPDAYNDIWKYDPVSGYWVWMGGTQTPEDAGNYSVKGIEDPDVMPAARAGAASWTDSEGNFWLFGGIRSVSSYQTRCNDLWKYNVSTGYWTWVSGTNDANAPGIYGTYRVEAAANMPSARAYASSWVDNEGNFWIFGGNGPVSGFPLNDLWKFNPLNNQWTWMNGSKENRADSTIGPGGFAGPHYTPSARHSSFSWTDPNGYFWLFGGAGLHLPELNDLWRLNPLTGNWAYINKELASYGTKGVTDPANWPPRRSGQATWVNADGELCFFGGYGYSDQNYLGRNNDIWTLQPAYQEETLYGDPTEFQVEVVHGQSLSSDVLEIWNAGSTGTVQYSITTDVNWVDVSPAEGRSSGSGQLHTLSYTSGALSPGRYDGRITITSNDAQNSQLQLPVVLHVHSDDTGAFAWMGGSKEPWASPVYGEKLVGDKLNTPGSRQNAANWTDGQGNLWLFGGSGSPNDLWKYELTSSTPTWIWTKGSNQLYQYPVPGTQGEPGEDNTPASLEWPSSWTDTSGNLWMFGGRGRGAIDGYGYLNDLWHYNVSTNEWTWVDGDGHANVPVHRGDKGVASEANTPGGRAGASTWTGPDNNLWVYGGRPYTPAGVYGDIWKYDLSTNQWTWIEGSGIINELPQYGELLDESTTGTPGARWRATAWSDQQGNFWLFGGITDLGTHNDLWRYSPSTKRWTWVSGSDQVNQPGHFGALGVEAAANAPRARSNAVGWVDTEGNFWLFGGFARAGTASGSVNDLWKYNTATNRWTWMKGTTGYFVPGVYGTMATADKANVPGARYLPLSWSDNVGGLWLYSGSGYSESGAPGLLNDLWRYSEIPQSGLDWDEVLSY